VGGARVALASVLLSATAGCDFTTGPSGPVANLVGEWTLTGSQAAPAFNFAGVLEVTAQDGATISGTASWTEPDGMGGSVATGGPLSGLVIDTTDVDFDLSIDGGERRHVGRIDHDTITGVWLQSPGGKSGQFRLVRSGL
jgi:hypothetical protein